MELNKENFVQISDRRTVQFEQTIDGLLLKGAAQFIVNDDTFTLESISFGVYSSELVSNDMPSANHIGEVYSSNNMLTVNVYNDEYAKGDFSNIANQLEELIKTEYVK